LSTGVPKALATINRRPKQETKHMIPDDGYVRCLEVISKYNRGS
jgi:hypothetical protein